jgi:hypothetical protein
MVYFWSQSNDKHDYPGVHPTDPFNQFAGTGQAHALTSADLANLDAFGYNLVTPEPASLTLLGTGLLALGGVYVRRRKRTPAM